MSTKDKGLTVIPNDGKPLVVGSANEIITITNGQVQMMRRKWWQIYKKGWHKHTDFWGEFNVDTLSLVALPTTCRLFAFGGDLNH